MNHILPRAAELDDATLEVVILPLLHQLGTAESLSPAVVATLKAVPCIPTQAGTRALPADVYDPRSELLRRLLGEKAPFPLQTWASTAHLDGLAALGMKAACSAPDVLYLDIARHISQDESFDVHARVQRAEALLEALEGLVQTQQPDAVGNTASGVSGNFWADLATLAFVPIHTTPPHEGLPWAIAADAVPLAAPAIVRPGSDMWIASGSMRIAKVACSDALAEALGWRAPPAANFLAAHLLELGRMHPAVEEAHLRIELGQAADKLYELLGAEDLSEGPKAELIEGMLAGGPVVWTGAGFVSTERIALDTPADFR